MISRSRILQAIGGDSSSHQENHLAHIGVRTMWGKWHRFFQFEISAGPSYPLDGYLSLGCRIVRGLSRR
jgi:hypothetical protein